MTAIVNRIPPPKGDPNGQLQALIFDSVFNVFRGIIVYFRILNGNLKKGDKVRFFHTAKNYEAEEIGILNDINTTTRITLW